MEQKICIDTDFAIEILKNPERIQFLKERHQNAEAYITVVTLFELLERETNLNQIEIFRNEVKVLNFDESSSRMASIVYKDLKRKGKMVDFRDIFTAAICIINNCMLATFNKKHFENIKELKLI